MAVFFIGLLLTTLPIFYHESVRLVGPGLGTILPNLQVFILVIIGFFFFKEKISMLFLLSVPLGFIGLFFIVGIDWGHMERLYKLGVYFGLAGAFCYATFLILLRKILSSGPGMPFFYALMCISLVSALFLGCEILRSGGSFKIPDMQSFFMLFALGLFSQTVGWSLISKALPKIKASLSGFILLLQPSLAFVWDVLFFQRPTVAINWIGVIILLAAIYISSPKQE